MANIKVLKSLGKQPFVLHGPESIDVRTIHQMNVKIIFERSLCSLSLVRGLFPSLNVENQGLIYTVSDLTFHARPLPEYGTKNAPPPPQYESLHKA